ncbi:RNA polymerase sigma factor [Maritimibacter sp. UBA3975]|uniref:RNA polymerase sigma factor n=1 Tax=Maritimibacter sp. UBA3975 TaxID=1946833 RepID=UPI000C0BB4CB|nr:RNA polymerase sigma factor [Maritimibacter sp. UBA3975]MAM61504.1 RNA polymerase subunit sigma-70 [Maritimibacter sp.]|tara:strand:- start:23099 stop:23656 length:558 start_codon:yes stop_codon:yes gene_type:complete
MDPRIRALEAYLVASARAGDRRDLSRLVALRGDRLMAHAVRLLGDREAARDVVQEAWVEIMRGLKSLRDDHAFLPWALRIVTRRVAREIARRQRGRAVAAAWAEEAETSVDEAGPQASDAVRVRAAIATLPRDQAATIALFYLEDLTVGEVATALDVPVGTVKTRLMHSRRKLRAILEGDDDEQD